MRVVRPLVVRPPGPVREGFLPLGGPEPMILLRARAWESRGLLREGLPPAFVDPSHTLAFPPSGFFVCRMALFCGRRASTRASISAVLMIFPVFRTPKADELRLNGPV